MEWVNCRLVNALSDEKEDENRLRIDGATDIAKNKWKCLNWISEDNGIFFFFSKKKSTSEIKN